MSKPLVLHFPLLAASSFGTRQLTGVVLHISSRPHSFTICQASWAEGDPTAAGNRELPHHYPGF